VSKPDGDESLDLLLRAFGVDRKASVLAALMAGALATWPHGSMKRTSISCAGSFSMLDSSLETW
jgi:hypothetical protein